MIEYIRFSYKLYTLERKKDLTKELYDKAIKKESNESPKRDDLKSEAHYFLSEFELKLRELYTDYLTKEARKLVLPLPPYNDKNEWDKPPEYTKAILTNNGISNLRAAIRSEKKERREIIFSWITLIIGLIGVLIGFFSVINK